MSVFSKAGKITLMSHNSMTEVYEKYELTPLIF